MRLTKLYAFTFLFSTFFNFTQKAALDSFEKFHIKLRKPKLESSQKKLAAERNHIIEKFCHELYQKNIMSLKKPLKDTIIPKKVHVIWIGPKSPPLILEKCLKSIQKYLPNWECILWTDKDVESLDLYNEKFYKEERNYGAKSDILRYEILYQFGGVYLDVDMLVVQPLDLLNHTYEFYIGLHPYYTKDIIGNAIIASVPKHPILKYCIETIKDKRHHINSVLQRTGPIHLQESFYTIAKQLSSSRIIAMPPTYFYFIEPDLRHVKNFMKYAQPESFTAHMWANTWIDKQKKSKKSNR